MALTLQRLSLLTFTVLSTVAVQLSTENIYIPWISASNKTNTYQPNPLYELCQCDLTALSCDPFCCCDNDCSFAVRAQWVDNQQCVNHNYDTASGAPLTDCLKQGALYDFNKKKGYQNYIDPFAKLFCIKVNNAPHMDWYYVDKTSLSNEEIDSLTSDPAKSGFVNTVFGSDAVMSQQSYYNPGDNMFAALTNGSISHNRAFQFPQPDVNGVCDNFKTPLFMHNSKSECIQVFDVEKQCESLVNSALYSTFLNVFAGQTSLSTKIPVTITEVYTVDRQTRQYILKDDLTNFNGSSLVRDTLANTCTCQNAMKEIHYTVNVQQEAAKDAYSTPYFKVVSVNATVVLTSTDITTQCGQKTQMQQKYSIEFLSTTSQVQQRSGNPGYIKGYPLLLGQVDQNTGAMSVYREGFELKGADTNGNCFSTPATSTINDYGDPVVNFGADLVYGCGLQLTAAELQDYCSNAKAKMGDLELFSNLNFIQRYGEFGNANIYFAQDWKDLKIDPSYALLGEVITSSDITKTCNFYANVHFKVFYSKMGFTDNPQAYVVDLFKYAIPETWTFSRQSDEEKQNFAHYVSFEFIEISSKNATNSSFIDPLAKNIPLDAFYPFMKMSNGMIQGVSAMMVFGAAFVSFIM